MVAIMLAGVMFPLWPPTMRLGVWYLSIGMLGLIGLFFVIAILRLIFYIITVIVASPGIWIFPKLFADVGFVRVFFLFEMSSNLTTLQVESFIPLWEWDVQKKKSKKKKGEKGEKSDKGKSKVSTNGGTAETPAETSDASPTPSSRRPRIEEVEDDDDA